jgi:hypothetical protein
VKQGALLHVLYNQLPFAIGSGSATMTQKVWGTPAISHSPLPLAVKPRRS